LAIGVGVNYKRIRNACETTETLTTLEVVRLHPKRLGLVIELGVDRGVALELGLGSSSRAREVVREAAREVGRELIGKGD
jgi:hypothetical protein